MASARPGRGRGCRTGIAFSKDAGRLRTSPPPICGRSGYVPSRATSSSSRSQRKPRERGRCRGPLDACWPGGGWRPPPGWKNSDESGSSGLISSEELSSKDGVGSSRRPRVTGWFWRLRLAKRYNTVLLTVINTLYIRFPRTYSFYNWKFISFDQHAPIPSPPSPGNHCSSLSFYEFGFFGFHIYKRDHTVFVFLWLPYFT